MTTFRTLTAALCSLTLLLGCDDPPEDTVVPEPETIAETAPETEAADEPEAVPAEGDDSEAGPLIDDPTFELRASAADSYNTGELGQFDIRITPRGEYHMNAEFPTTVSIRSVDGVTFPKSEMEQSDAAEFGEQLARFDVPFTADAAGEHRVVCDVSFAVCTESNCIPEERTLALLLPVQ